MKLLESKHPDFSVAVSKDIAREDIAAGRFVQLVPSDLKDKLEAVGPGKVISSDRQNFMTMLFKGRVIFRTYNGQFDPFHTVVTIEGSSHTEIDFIFDTAGNFLERQAYYTLNDRMS